MPCDIFAFDEGGKVVEANVIEAPNPSRPKTITSVSPLRVAYERDSGQTVVCGGKFSQATWLHDVQKREDLDERCREILESWRRSGSTNLGVVRQEIDDAIANSKK
jgi:hypothetical protein